MLKSVDGQRGRLDGEVEKMPRLVYEGKLPSPEQFKADWAHALATTSPIDDLLELAAELKDFEQKYNMT